MRALFTCALATMFAATVGCGGAQPIESAESPDEIGTSTDALWVDGDFQRLPERRGDLVQYLEDLPVASQFVLDTQRSAPFRAMMDALFAARTTGGWCTAIARAQTAGYELTRFYDEGTYSTGTAVRRYFVVARDVRGGGQATVVINPSPARNLVLEAPHSDSEGETRSESAYLFRELGARGLILNGANRCALARSSTCTAPGDGVTICGKWEANYRKSDAAHWHENTFHDAHVSFDRKYAPLFVQLHGFEPSGDFWAVTSDGLRPSLGERHASLSVRFRDALRQRLPSAVRAGSCQCDDDGAHRTLCGDLNLQGRATNQGDDTVCTTSSTVSGDRFLHLEQHPSLAGRDRWRVRDALKDIMGACTGAGAVDCPSVQLVRVQRASCS